MSEPSRWQRAALQWLRRLPRHVTAIVAMGAAFSLVALVYFSYDLAKGRLSPCEAVYQQTAVGLTTRMKFLKTEGELQIGRAQLTELDERAQMAALNLKTCCTVLDAGRLDPEQFLQCKGKARAYESQLGDIADLVRQAVKDGITTASIAANAEPTPATPPASAPAPAPGHVQAEIANEVATARQISQSFNREIVEVRKTQAVERLQATPPRNVAIEAQESEPNDDMLTTNSVPLGKWVTGAIGGGKDRDYFVFTTPETHRDWIRIELQNRSTTLEPRLELFDAEKTSRGEVHKTTPGADAVYSFVAPPAKRYSVRVSNYYGESSGVYLLRVVATQAYDASEPNDDILHAKAVSLGEPVAAAIMDAHDTDHFTFTAGDEEGSIAVKVQNRSATLQPEVAVYNAAKGIIGTAKNTTAGGDTGYTIKIKPGAAYYVRVRDYYSSAAGDYTLTIEEVPPGDG